MIDELQIAPPLDATLYAESYELRKAASTMTTVAIDWLSQQASELLSREPAVSHDKTFSVLSVGSGEGDLDMKFINALQAELLPQWEGLRYVALEPNASHRQGFYQRLDAEPLDHSVNVSIHDQRMEDLDLNEHQQRYDLVLFVHVFYYFESPQRIIEDALALVKEGGQVIIVHQTPTGIPEIQRRYMREIKGNTDEMFTTSDIQTLLNASDISHQYHELDAHLDVTQCLRQTDAGLKIMSFCMECDLRALNERKFGQIFRAFENLAETQLSGEAYLHEPIGVFILQSPHVQSVSYNGNGFDDTLTETDPVDDYRQLARHFDWRLLSPTSRMHPQNRSTPLRLLDVACGTGRWLDALYRYASFPTYLNGAREILYDVLDPSETAIVQIRNKISAPFRLGNQYVTTIQEADLERQVYDLLWSNHGFYGIPVPHLPSVLTKLADSLTKRGTALIALANRNSFYITFYDQYLATVYGGNQTGFTAAEDVMDALDILGIAYQIHPIHYEERIDRNDHASLAHYVINESTINSFNKDKEQIDAPISGTVTLDELRGYAQLQHFLDSFIDGSAYYFPQEVQVISFGNVSA